MNSGDECARRRDIAATGSRWYVVQTRHHGEARAVAHLERQGYRVFCPRYRKTIRHARKARSVLAPLFPNYVFVLLNFPSEPWRSVNSTSGVVRLISQGESPQPVPHGVVEALLRSTRGDGAVELAPRIRIGETVRIAEGPLADLLGTLEMLDTAGRVRVLLHMLGRSVSVALPAATLVSAA